jgi:hypothetical protein
MFGDRMHVRLDKDHEGATESVAAALSSAGLTVSSIREIAPALEDVFVAKLGETT